MTESILAVRGIEKTSELFRWELVQVGKRLNINADFLAAVMAVESGFNAQAVNPNGGAVGLIQFMPKTATRLGTSSAELLRMTAAQQLVYVEKFYAPWAGRLRDVGAAYMATFLPVFVGAPRDVVIAERDSSEPVSAGNTLTKGKVYSFNAALDSNKDGKILAGEVYGFVERRIASANGERIPVAPPPGPFGGSGGGSADLLPALVLGAVGLLVLTTTGAIKGALA